MYTASQVARDVAKLRAAREWTQAQMAQRLKASEKSVRRWEAGEVMPQAGWRRELGLLAREVELFDLAQRIAPDLDRPPGGNPPFITFLPKLLAVLVANFDVVPEKELAKLQRVWREMWQLGRRWEQLHLRGEIRIRSVSRLTLLTHLFDPFFAQGKDLQEFYKKEKREQWRETVEKVVAGATRKARSTRGKTGGG